MLLAVEKLVMFMASVANERYFVLGIWSQFSIFWLKIDLITICHPTLAWLIYRKTNQDKR